MVVNLPCMQQCVWRMTTLPLVNVDQQKLYLYNQSSSFSNCLLENVMLKMAQAVIIMSANNQLTDDAFQIKNTCKDPERTNEIQVEAEEEDGPHQ